MCVFLKAPFQLLWRHRELLFAMVQRDLIAPFAGQILGRLWIVIQPLFPVVFLTIVFSGLVGSQMPVLSGSQRDYTTYILAGLIPWQAISLSLSRSCGEIIGNANLVKQVVFPIEVLPIKGVVFSMISGGIGLIFLLLYGIVFSGVPPATYWLIPLLLFIQILWMCGIAFILSSISVYLRDLKDIIAIVLTISVYMLPIVYLPNAIPNLLQPLIYINPFSYLIWCYQDIFFYGSIEHPFAWLITPLIGFSLFYSGYTLFKYLKPYFGSVL